MNPKRNTPRHIIIKLVKVKDKKNLKSIKRKATSYIHGKPQKAISRFFDRNYTSHKGETLYIQSAERKNLQPRILYQARLFI